ncbi:unnamed protein product [Lactuca saligna]|uniref:Uncharacterized protein n=1 Tax=Lactuca saligna TaxID=75948 RepID=A0AA35YJM0_LACSI|nr:unnamed protein product [Lactuca saligna]
MFCCQEADPRFQERDDRQSASAFCPNLPCPILNLHSIARRLRQIKSVRCQSLARRRCLGAAPLRTAVLLQCYLAPAAARRQSPIPNSPSSDTIL